MDAMIVDRVRALLYQESSQTAKQLLAGLRRLCVSKAELNRVLYTTTDVFVQLPGVGRGAPRWGLVSEERYTGEQMDRLLRVLYDLIHSRPGAV